MYNAVNTATRIVSAGSDVLIVGDDGAGKSWALDRIATATRKLGGVALLISGRETWPGGPFAPLVAAGARLGATELQTPERIRSVFGDKLEGATPSLVVDDIDSLNAPSVDLLRELLAASGSQLICSAGLTATDASTARSPHLSLLAERAPSLVTLPPLAVDELDRLVVDVLKGQSDAAFLANLSTQAGGNPRVATALLTAGVVSGLIARRDGLWTEVGSLEDVPADAVVLALTGRLSPEEKQAIGLLAWSGPLPAGELERLIPSATLLALNQRGRIAWTQTRSDSDVRVSPPALSRGLRQTFTDQQRHHFVELAENALADDFGLNRKEAPGAILPWAESSVQFDRKSAEFAGLISERGAIQESAARALWTRVPSVQNACGYLSAITTEKSPKVIEHIFSGTAFAEDDSLLSRTKFSIYELQWRVSSEPAGTDQSQWLEEMRSRLGPTRELIERIHRAMHIEAEERPLTPELIDELGNPTESDYGSSWSTVMGAAFELEACRPDDALERLDAAPDLGEHSWSTTYLEHSRTEGLLQLGWLADAERWSRRRARHYYNELDPVSYQFHILGLARTLVRRGRFQEAWSAISDGLGLPTGRALVSPRAPLFDLAAVIQAELGNVALARVLLDEAEDRLHPHIPLFVPRIVVARAAVARASGDHDGSDALLWEGGLAAAELGYLATACECWSGLSTIPPEQAGPVQRVLERIESPAYTAVLRLSLANGAGDVEAILTAVRDGDELLPTNAVNGALRTVDRIRAQSGLSPLSEAERAVMYGSRSPQERRDSDALSLREREVAVLARAGLSNREIAHRLFVSVRTVENHMYRILRKLGLRSRQQLSEEWQPEG